MKVWIVCMNLFAHGTDVIEAPADILKVRVAMADCSSVMYPTSFSLAVQFLDRRILFREAEAQLRRHLPFAGLSPLDFCCLCMVAGAERHPDGVGLSEAIRIDKSAVAKLIARLCSKRLVTRYKDVEDRRRFRLRLTKKGHHYMSTFEQLSWSK